jgi:hypothetical protein
MASPNAFHRTIPLGKTLAYRMRADRVAAYLDGPNLTQAMGESRGSRGLHGTSRSRGSALPLVIAGPRSIRKRSPSVHARIFS